MRYITKTAKTKILSWFIVLALGFTGAFALGLPQSSYAAPREGVDGARCVGRNCNQGGGNQNNQNNQNPAGCGTGDSRVETKINFGCNGANKNPVIDLAFALIRFLSFGVGIAVVASIVYAGVSYTTAEGNPEKSAQAKSRIQNSILALFLYLFIFAIIQYLVPGGLFN
jgi:type IV secretion system pilin